MNFSCYWRRCAIILVLAVASLVGHGSLLLSQDRASATVSTQPRSTAPQPAAAEPFHDAEGDIPYPPRPEWIPDWAQPGHFYFARADGGPIELEKVKKSVWGRSFSGQDNEILGNLYGKYADQMVDMLAKAGVNWVWITWSVGFSWQHEAEQRKLATEMVKRLHRRGIHVAAYMDAITIMWQNMFLDQPESVGWIDFAPSGEPYMYTGGGISPLRFIANTNNPGWIQLEEKRVGAAIDAGFDAIFFDNTNSTQQMASFFQDIRRYIHQEKHSHILLFANSGFQPDRIQRDRYTDAVFDESFVEPGAWGNEWDVSNIRRFRYLRGVIPAWKPLITEYSIFRKGNRSTTFLSPRSERLAIAEAAAFGGGYAWDSEGPFDDALIHKNPAAMASWSSIGEYNAFLRKHQSIYEGITPIANYLVLIPDADIGFSWRQEKNPLYDTLAEKSILYAASVDSKVDEKKLKEYPVALIAKNDPWPKALRLYQEHGGQVDVVNGSSKTEIEALQNNPPACASLHVISGAHVLGNIVRLQGDQGLAVHILNYDQNPVRNVRVEVRLGTECREMVRGRVEFLSPDNGGTDTTETIPVSDDRLKLTLPKLDTYTVMVIR